MRRRSPTLRMKRSDALNNERDHRSYKEVVMGGILEQSWNGVSKVVKGYKSMKKIKGVSENLEKGECSGLKKEGTKLEPKSVAEFNQFIQDSEYKWLFNCAIGKLKESVNVESIASSLKEKGLACQVYPAGGVSVLLRFESLEELKHFLKDHISLYEAWFDDYEDCVSDELLMESRVVSCKNLKGQTVEKGLLSKEEVWTSVDDSSWCLCEHAKFSGTVTAHREYSSQLSVTEMIGTPGIQSQKVAESLNDFVSLLNPYVALDKEDVSARLEDVEVGSPEPQSSFGPKSGMEMTGLEEWVSALAIVPWIG
ncbi:hypothetical protein PTKIN_Ptkin11bG0065800 [Pterospermum kingtungense]